MQFIQINNLRLRARKDGPFQVIAPDGRVLEEFEALQTGYRLDALNSGLPHYTRRMAVTRQPGQDRCRSRCRERAMA
jgi:hypothetical protein